MIWKREFWGLNFWSKCFEFPEPEVQFPAQNQVANFFFGCFLYLSDKFLIFQVFWTCAIVHPHFFSFPYVLSSTMMLIILFFTISDIAIMRVTFLERPWLRKPQKTCWWYGLPFQNISILVWYEEMLTMTSIRDKRRNSLAHPEHASHLVVRLMGQL